MVGLAKGWCGATLYRPWKSLICLVMKIHPFILALFASAAALCRPLGCGAAARPLETQLAEDLNRIGCQVELTLTDGRVTVHRVRASGRITSDGMQTEPLPEELFAHLKRLGHVRSLALRVTAGDRDRARLRALTSLASLRELELFGKDVNDEVMPFVCSLTNLESLSLWDVSVGEEGLAHLPTLKVLRRLELSDFINVNKRGVEAIGKLHDLEYLRINGQCEEGALLLLKGLPRLESVWIGGFYINSKLAELKTIPTIHRIEIAGAEIDAGTADHLLAMTNLQSLKLECCSLTPEAVKGLRSLRLRELDCVGISAGILAELAKPMAERHGDLRVWY